MNNIEYSSDFGNISKICLYCTLARIEFICDLDSIKTSNKGLLYDRYQWIEEINSYILVTTS